MNERLKELVGQAKFIAEETINKKISKNAELDAFAEKFAELIVRECTGRLRDIDWGLAIMEEFGVEPTCPNDVSLFAAIDIEEHFGIERYRKVKND